MAILLKAISASDTTLMFSEEIGFPSDNGLIQIDNELISYLVNYQGTLYGCIRGVSSTTPAIHLVGSSINLLSYFVQPSSGATTSLSNLAAVAINAALLPNTNGTRNLGSSSAQWGELYLATRIIVSGAGSVTSPAIVLGSATGTGFYLGTGGRLRVARSGLQIAQLSNDLVDFTVDTLNAFRIDGGGGANDTTIFVYDYDTTSLQRVSVGAADSGGIGYKVLRIPN